MNMKDWRTSIAEVISTADEEEVLVRGHTLSELTGSISFVEMMYLMFAGPFPPMMLGGLIIGSVAGLVGVALYKILALRAQARYPSSKYVESNNGEDKE